MNSLEKNHWKKVALPTVSVPLAIVALVSCGQCPCTRHGLAATGPSADPETAEGVVPEGPEVRAWHPSKRCTDLASDYVAKMTIDEKAGQMTQAAIRFIKPLEDISTYHLGSVLAGGSDEPKGGIEAEHWADYADAARELSSKTRLGIPLIFGIDSVHGMGKAVGATIFPHNIGLGASRDPALVRKVSRIAAVESRGAGVDWVFAPVLAAARDERWGRTYEAFGESPDLAAELGRASVLGFQNGSLGADSTSVLACAKHFAGDGATLYGTSHMGEKILDRGDARMDMTTFRELAIDQFRPSIEAGVGSIMVSYSSFNGVKMHQEKYLLTTVLKKELGFKGFVVSDWKGIDDIPGDFTNDVAEALNAGIDMVMVPDRYREFIDTVKTLEGKGIPAERIDDAVSRILAVKCEMGLFDKEYSTKTDRALTASMRADAHREVAREAVQKSLVLLQNQKDLLPLNKEKNIHVAGSAADNLDVQCGGWTITWMGAGSRTAGTTVRRAIEKAVGADRVSYSIDATEIPEQAEAAIVVVGEPPYAEWKGDKEDLHLSREDITTIENAAAADIPVVVVLLSGRPMIITPLLKMADAWVAAWLPGTEGDGVADILFGDARPSGKLSHSWPKRMSDIPTNKEDLHYAPLYPYGFGLTYKD